MRHRHKTIKLGRSASHREALLASLVCHLIEQKRIKTTLPKARAARSLADKMVTLGKRGTLADRRRAVAKLGQKARVKQLFEEVAPGFADRAGGYTRIIKLGQRDSDSSEMVLLEWVESTSATAGGEKEPKAAAKKPARKKAAKKATPEAAADGDSAASATEEPKPKKKRVSRKKKSDDASD